jgi:hypothetical protein
MSRLTIDLMFMHRCKPQSNLLVCYLVELHISTFQLYLSFTCIELSLSSIHFFSVETATYSVTTDFFLINLLELQKSWIVILLYEVLVVSKYQCLRCLSWAGTTSVIDEAYGKCIFYFLMTCFS